MEGLWLGSWLRFILGTRLGPYVPTPPHVVRRMLSLAAVSADDCVHDVGCGDGRALLAAAQEHGARAVGYELDARLAAAAAEAVAKAGLQHRIDVRQGDAREACFESADVVLMYLSETGNARARVTNVAARLRACQHTPCLCSRADMRCRRPPCCRGCGSQPLRALPGACHPRAASRSRSR